MAFTAMHVLGAGATGGVQINIGHRELHMAQLVLIRVAEHFYTGTTEYGHSSTRGGDERAYKTDVFRVSTGR